MDEIWGAKSTALVTKPGTRCEGTVSLALGTIEHRSFLTRVKTLNPKEEKNKRKELKHESVQPMPSLNPGNGVDLPGLPALTLAPDLRMEHIPGSSAPHCEPAGSSLLWQEAQSAPSTTAHIPGQGEEMQCC